MLLQVRRLHPLAERENRRLAEPPEPPFDAVAPREVRGPLLPPEREPDVADVYEAAREMVGERDRSHVQSAFQETRDKTGDTRRTRCLNPSGSGVEPVVACRCADAEARGCRARLPRRGPGLRWRQAGGGRG